MTPRTHKEVFMEAIRKRKGEVMRDQSIIRKINKLIFWFCVALAFVMAAGISKPVPVQAAEAPEYSDLVAWYTFNGDAQDASGNGNHGIINGGAIFTEDRFGNTNAALSFDGTDDYVELPNESNFDLTALTIVAIVKVQNYDITNHII
jgi:hypothetical protein